MPIQLGGSVIEAGLASLMMTSLALGPFSFRSLAPAWPVAAALFFVAYLAIDVWIIRQRTRRGIVPSRPLLFSLLLPVTYTIVLGIVQSRPRTIGVLWDVTSPIQPFPLAAMATLVLLVALLKVVSTSGRLPSLDRSAVFSSAANLGIPVGLLLLGIFQSTVYIVVINNPTFRFWGIADGIFLGQGYPLTLTEPGPVSAGSPPYVYDLPLFPLLLRLSFSIVGHTSVGAHIPSLLFSILFPFSLYLLIRQATGSRVIGVLFSALASSFSMFRFWVLNLPDPDPFFLTSLCLAAYFYLRALAARESAVLWLVAGLFSGITSLARPEGMLYAGCLGLGVLISRPRLRHFALYAVAVGLFVLPMVAVWVTNFGFLWPQNYNKTLALSHPLDTYNLLKSMGSLTLYHRALGMGAEWAVGLLVGFILWVLLGTVAALRSPRLLPILIPAIGNTATIAFTHVWISNAFNYVDFFRHAAFGIPFMVMATAYGFHVASSGLRRAGRLTGLIPWLATLLLIAAVARETDILANPTATHRTGSPLASQALSSYPNLSLQTIVEHPMQIPQMEFYHDQTGALVAQLPGVQWPEVAIEFFKPLDMAYDSHGRAFGYASLVAFLLALAFAGLAERGEAAALKSRL